MSARAIACLAAGVALAAAAWTASADEGRSRAPANPAFLNECGGCHVPYPAKLLSAPAWRTIMHGLDRHFGTDASVDAATAAAIGSYLEANAGSGRKVARDPNLVRVTESPRFVRKHDDIPAAVWRSPKVQGAANCGACHAGAQQGRFGDDARIPR